MRKKAEKIPRAWTHCTKCDHPYDYWHTRITFKNPTRDICLKCAVEEEREHEQSKVKQTQETVRREQDLPLVQETTQTVLGFPTEQTPPSA